MTSFSARAAALAKFWLFSLAIALALLGPGLASADGFRPFDRIVVFGDSLSDSGNLHAIFASTPDLPDVLKPGGPRNNWGMDTPKEWATLIPDQAYLSGRLSNGPTWVELLGTALGLALNVRPVFANTADHRRFNFAVAGATAANPDDLPPDNPFHLGGQINVFLARALAPNGTGTTSDTLYVIAIGGNDVRAGPAALGVALPAVTQAIKDLYLVGGRKFLIWNIPDLGATPAFDRLEKGVEGLVPADPDIKQQVRSAIGLHNAGLEATLRHLASEEDGALPGTEFIYFDTFNSLSKVARFGLNLEQSCIQITLSLVASACAHPDRRFFWDGIHPTRAGHAVSALLVAKELARALAQDD